jgi:hypothetical protein
VVRRESAKLLTTVRSRSHASFKLKMLKFVNEP